MSPAIDESRRAVEAAGLAYLHMAFDGQNPDSAVADAFIRAVADPRHQPVFIHCASANRVSALLLAKRLVADGCAENYLGGIFENTSEVIFAV